MPLRELRCIHFNDIPKYLGKDVYALKRSVPAGFFLLKVSPRRIWPDKHGAGCLKRLEYRMSKALTLRWHEHQIISAQCFVNLNVIQRAMKENFYISRQCLEQSLTSSHINAVLFGAMNMKSNIALINFTQRLQREIKLLYR